MAYYVVFILRRFYSHWSVSKANSKQVSNMYCCRYCNIFSNIVLSDAWAHATSFDDPVVLQLQNQQTSLTPFSFIDVFQKRMNSSMPMPIWKSPHLSAILNWFRILLLFEARACMYNFIGNRRSSQQRIWMLLWHTNSAHLKCNWTFCDYLSVVQKAYVHARWEA